MPSSSHLHTFTNIPQVLQDSLPFKITFFVPLLSSSIAYLSGDSATGVPAHYLNTMLRIIIQLLIQVNSGTDFASTPRPPSIMDIINPPKAPIAPTSPRSSDGFHYFSCILSILTGNFIYLSSNEREEFK